MKPLHDIRDQMPKFAANFFQRYEYQPYPRMMVNKETGKPYLDSTKKPVIVQDEHEEKLFLARHYKPDMIEPAKAIDVPVVADPVIPVTVLASTAQPEEAPKRRGRPPAPKNLTA